MTRKQILIYLSLLLSVAVRAQVDSTVVEADSIEIREVTLPDSTAVGAPDGKLVSKEIGPSGGTIISDDGRVQLNFPEGALQATTAISVQPIANLIPNGNGKAYKFEPSGIKFSKPVEVIFHYSEQEEESCPHELKFIALQNSTGKLEYMRYNEWDSATRSLKGTISHFSAVIDGNMLELNTVDSTLRVRQTLNLFLIVVTPPVATAPGEDDLPPLPQNAPNNPSRTIRWTVEGGRRYGTISVQANRYGARYTAPNLLPGGDAKVILKVNETTIRTVVQRSRRWRGVTRIPTTRNLGTFTCNIKLYDEYQVKVKAVWDNTNIRPNLGTTRWEDEAGFDLRIGSKIEMNNITNSLFQLVVEHFTPTCTFSFPNKTSCIGPVHVSGIKGSGISYSSASSYTTATIDFEQTQHIVVPIINIISCRGRPANPLPPLTMLNSMPAMPYRLKFDLKDGEQTIEIKDAAVAQLGKIEYTVKRKP